ncbi:unnamed protein product [Rotaria magnacalcarata]|uniref:Uncharacterized protein n=4 Tax=Rotaria magnacalcarata TaxID=392030 RepID=A0A819P2K2_9BILA|nr:unnamed protein product [Rotaria magnacalcarata]CAF2108814.1 unnamed protein product [Rotaria magnacalcarata]CAF2154095.1 unnamed protein product [Rotaria magnacalcarata]CAF2211463.1 unnamed protein product [Rotaria magnacalcarata]CAF3851524.1 unnamed protein product [Rotaria magnacalcarata]
MIHVRIDNQNSTAVDIYVNISPKNTITTSSPIPISDYRTNENVYDRLFDTTNFTSRQSKIVKNRKDYVRPIDKKHYTLEQILNNVETIQKQYEQVVHHRTTPASTPSCFFTFKQITKLLKNLRTIKTKSNDENTINKQYSEHKSPFVFGGETLQWIAFPQDDSHIYENEFIE